jgi:opacity protein-like surface antigen
MPNRLLIATIVFLSAATARAQGTPPVTEGTVTSSDREVAGEYEVDKRRDQGWNAPWGLVFTFNNILVNGSFLSNYQNLGTAAALVLSEDLMIRGGVSLSRTHTPPQTTETTTNNAGAINKTYQYAAGQTSSGSVTLRGDAVYRLLRNKVAPFVGGGPYVTVTHARQTSDDDVTVDNVVTSIRNRSTSFTAGVRGLVGAEWRVHANFAVFAEYQLAVDVIQYTNSDNTTTVSDKTTGSTVVNSTRVVRSVPAWFNASNTLSQGASLGLLVLF